MRRKFSAKEYLKKIGSRMKTIKQNLFPYAEACDSSQNFDWAAELLSDYFVVAKVYVGKLISI